MIWKLCSSSLRDYQLVSVSKTCRPLPGASSKVGLKKHHTKASRQQGCGNASETMVILLRACLYQCQIQQRKEMGFENLVKH